MGLFNTRKSDSLPPRQPPAPVIPVLPYDLSKRYDVYCSVVGEERVYENIRFVAIRTFDRITEYSSGLVGGHLEIESADGSKMLIPTYGIQMICEHGTHPTFKVLRRWKSSPMEY